ncbi:hypothetical protein M9H77_30207 [Catharanthus roseus]|uniref:Uncharacterized protein n=1 Tax=Catharanthus roseus TaxID=4058 RepID=A0ACB9ZWL0_CATRO|nr:hypothetical protein M9H77_30207 [Catharanthus roseus]
MVGLPLPLMLGFCRHHSGGKTPTANGFPLECGRYKMLNRGSSIKGGDLGKDLDPILPLKEDSHQSAIRETSNYSLIMSTNGRMPTQSHYEGTSDPSRMNLNETLRSMQQFIEGLARQFRSIARDIEELKNGKSSATMKKRFRDNLGGFNSPYHQRPFENVSSGYLGRPQVRDGRRGGLGGRGYHRPQDEFQRHEAWHEDNLYEDYGDNPHPKKEDTPNVPFKDHPKPKVEEKGRLITNQTSTFLGDVVNFKVLEVGANMEQAIQDWLIFKSAFKEGSFHGFTSCYKKFINDLSILASLLMDEPKKKTRFTWKLCMSLFEIASNQAYCFPILYSSFEVDYGDNLLKSSDLTLLLIDHALSLGELMKVEFVKYILFKDHDAIDVHNKMFAKK